MSSSATASAYLHGFAANFSSDPPQYNDVVKMNELPPSAPLMWEHSEAIPAFSSIFGVATNVQFEWSSSYSGLSFLIRDTDGSLQAKGDVTSYNTTVQNVNCMEMMKIIERDVDEVNGNIVHTFSVIHKHNALSTVKVTEKTTPSSSLQITGRNGASITVNSLKIGDYAMFRGNLLSTPLCNIQMPDVESFSGREFNIKIIFHPQTGITEDEQLLCTAAAIAFKITMKQSTKIASEDSQCTGYVCGFICLGIFVCVLIMLYILLDKWGCNRKKYVYVQ